MKNTTDILLQLAAPNSLPTFDTDNKNYLEISHVDQTIASAASINRGWRRVQTTLLPCWGWMWFGMQEKPDIVKILLSYNWLNFARSAVEESKL